MQKIYLLSGFLLLLGCKDNSQKTIENAEIISDISTTSLNEIKYAEGFKIEQHLGYKTITLTNAWPGAEETFTYALVEKGTDLTNPEDFNAVVQVPVKSIVVTSTTHIPSLEMLDVHTSLVGFPNTQYISSETTRKRIDNNEVIELGRNEDINTELLIDLSPDVVITFAVEGGNKTITTIQKTGIPVMYNSDWTETSPLGKAEWIKFFGALFNKETTANQLFEDIETAYFEARDLAKTAKKSPTVLSGAMYKDVWYLPQGNSWAAQFIEDANASYLWKDSQGTGSLSLHLEAVLEKGQQAEFWIGPGQFTSLQQMKDTHTVYEQFDAYASGEVYSFTTKKGATGGVLYYELAPNRPDLVLKDMIKILHPHLLPDYKLHFFSVLE